MSSQPESTSQSHLLSQSQGSADSMGRDGAPASAAGESGGDRRRPLERVDELLARVAAELGDGGIASTASSAAVLGEGEGDTFAPEELTAADDAPVSASQPAAVRPSLQQRAAAPAPLIPTMSAHLPIRAPALPRPGDVQWAAAASMAPVHLGFGHFLGAGAVPGGAMRVAPMGTHYPWPGAVMFPPR